MSNVVLLRAAPAAGARPVLPALAADPASHGALRESRPLAADGWRATPPTAPPRPAVAPGAVRPGNVASLPATAGAVPPIVHQAFDDEHWREVFAFTAAREPQHVYDDYEPAYRLGYLRLDPRLAGCGTFTEAEPALRRAWAVFRGESRLDWLSARECIREAWDHAGSVGMPRAAG